MGYDYHVTRAVLWTDTSEAKISAEEWLDYVRNDPELVSDPPNGDFAVTWIGGDSGEAGDEAPWFDWSEGNIYTTSPAPQTMEKMLRIAADLEASVQGDNGELCRDPASVRE